MHHPILASESGERLLTESAPRLKHSKQHVIACSTITLIVLVIVVTASAYVLGYFTGQHVHDWNDFCALRTSKYCNYVKSTNSLTQLTTQRHWSKQSASTTTTRPSTAHS